MKNDPAIGKIGLLIYESLKDTSDEKLDGKFKTSLKYLHEEKDIKKVKKSNKARKSFSDIISEAIKNNEKIELDNEEKELLKYARSRKRKKSI